MSNEHRTHASPKTAASTAPDFTSSLSYSTNHSGTLRISSEGTFCLAFSDSGSLHVALGSQVQVLDTEVDELRPFIGHNPARWSAETALPNANLNNVSCIYFDPVDSEMVVVDSGTSNVYVQRKGMLCLRYGTDPDADRSGMEACTSPVAICRLGRERILADFGTCSIQLWLHNSTARIVDCPSPPADLCALPDNGKAIVVYCPEETPVEDGFENIQLLDLKEGQLFNMRPRTGADTESSNQQDTFGRLAERFKHTLITQIRLLSDPSKWSPSILVATQSGIYISDVKGLREPTLLVAGDITAMDFHAQSNCLAYSTVNSGTYIIRNAISTFSKNCFQRPQLQRFILDPHSMSAVPSVLSFLHKASGKLFHLHTPIVEALHLNTSSGSHLVNLWSDFKCSEEAICSFLAYWYGATPGEIRQYLRSIDRADRSGPSSLTTELSHWKTQLCAIYVLLCKTLPTTESLRLFAKEISTVVKSLSHDEQFDLLLMVITDWDRNEFLSTRIVRLLREDKNIFVRRAADLFSKSRPETLEDPAYLVKLIQGHVSGIPSATAEIAEPDADPVWKYLFGLCSKLEWRSGHPEPKDRRAPGSYIFNIEGVEGYVESYDWLLLPQWKYFKNLLASGCEETKTALVTLPAGFPKPVLLSIIHLCCGNSFRELSEEDASFVVEHCEEYGLVDITNGLSLPPFKTLVNEATRQLISFINIDNCLELFQKHQHTPLLKTKLLDFIGANWSTIAISKTSELQDLPEDMLAHLIKNMKVPKPEKV